MDHMSTSINKQAFPPFYPTSPLLQSPLYKQVTRMGFFKRAAVYLGFAHETNLKPDDNNNRNHNKYTNNSDQIRHNRMNVDPIPTGPRKGFSVPVQLPLDRQLVGPIIYPSAHHHGGVQGLRWYAGSLKTDEDGDVANEFLYEFSADMSGISQDRVKPRFLESHNVRPAEIKQQRMTQDGKLQCGVDRQGQLLWI